MLRRTVWSAGIVALLGSLVFSACAPVSQPPAPTPALAAKTAVAATPTAKPAASAPATPPAAPKPEKVVLAIPSAGFADLFTVVAEKKGFYRDEGFEVDKQVVKSDVAVKAVAAGEIAYTRAIGSALRAAAQGIGVKGIIAAQTRPSQLLVSRAEFKSVQDLKGKLVAIDSVQGTTHVMMQIILKHFGMDPDKDVTAVAMADSPTRFKMVQSGTAQAAMLDLALAIKAEGEGLKILANAADITERIMGGIATSDKRIKEKPDEVLRFVRAHVKALKYMRDPKNRDEMIQIMVNEVQLSKEEATKTYEMGIKGFSEDGSISEAAVQAEIDDAKAVGGVTKDVPITQVFDYSFVRKLKE